MPGKDVPVTAKDSGGAPWTAGGRTGVPAQIHAWPRWAFRMLIVIAVVLLAVANIAVWVNLSFVNASRFVDTAVGVLQHEDMRHAIAQKSVDKLMGDRPAVLQVVEHAMVNAVTDLLGTPALQDALRTIASQLQPMLITGEKPTITIESRAAEAIVRTVQAVAPGETPAVQRSGGAVTIELFARRDIPSLAPYVNAIQWAGIVSGVVGVGLLALLTWGSPGWPLGLRRAALAVMSAAVASGILILILGLGFISQVPDASAKTIVSGVYRPFAVQFLVQSAILFLVGLVAWVVGWRRRGLVARD